jgi:hypothetical protein
MICRQLDGCGCNGKVDAGSPRRPRQRRQLMARKAVAGASKAADQKPLATEANVNSPESDVFVGELTAWRCARTLPR